MRSDCQVVNLLENHVNRSQKGTRRFKPHQSQQVGHPMDTGEETKCRKENTGRDCRNLSPKYPPQLKLIEVG